MIVFDLDPETCEYGFRLDGPYVPAAGHRFDKGQVLLDPMAHAVSGRDSWGEQPDLSRPCPYRARIIPRTSTGKAIGLLELPMQDLIIYEMHVRGFTRSLTSGCQIPGTFAGVREKIPYLKSLGRQLR